MKRFSFSTLAVAGLLLTACSEKDVIAEGGGQQGEVLSDGYMALNINLPTTSSTRAINDDFADGETEGNEYAVHDCALLLFQGTSESNATLLSAQEFEIRTEQQDIDDDNITTSFTITSQVKNISTNNTLYALALLNYKNVIKEISSDGEPTFNTADGSEAKVGKQATLADIREKITDKNLTTSTSQEISPDGTKNYFFMANALLSTTPGGKTNPTTPSEYEIFQLAKLNPSKIFDKKEKAEADPAGEIVVERAVAKATMKLAETVTTAGGSTFTIAENGVQWLIDNTEPSTYIVRNPGTDLTYMGYKSAAFSDTDSRAYRFVGASPTQAVSPAGTKDAYYRTYWCIDPQYDKEEGVTMNSNTTFASITTPLYCNENTFDVLRQNYKNTTRAVVKVTLAEKTKFYTVSGVDGIFKGEQAFADATSHIVDYIVKKTEVINAFNDNKKPQQEEEEDWTIDASCFNIEYTIVDDSEEAGAVQVKTLALSQNVLDEIDETDDASTTDKKFKKGLSTALNQTALDKIKEAVNQSIVVLKYMKGEMFYEARFKHFAGDPVSSNGTIAANDLAPWNSGSEWENPAPSGGSTATAYPEGTNRNQNYLGRYGMVRNNWYDVEITSFNKLGYPVIPSVKVENPGYDGPDTPDDNINEYMSVKIHVLSWAKRTQSWGF